MPWQHTEKWHYSCIYSYSWSYREVNGHLCQLYPLASLPLGKDPTVPTEQGDLLAKATLWLDCVWNVMAHAQKPDFVFWWNIRVHLNRQGHQFSRLLADEVCASAIVMLDTPCSEVVWRVLATHSICQFLLHFPSCASPCAITFQLDSTFLCHIHNWNCLEPYYHLFKWWQVRISNLIHIFIPNTCHRQKMLSNKMTSMRRLILKCQWIYTNSAVKWCWHHKFMFQLMWIIVTFSCKHINSVIFYMQICRQFVP